MFVKVGNQIYDSKQEPITILFEDNEKMLIKRMTHVQNMFTMFSRATRNGLNEEQAAELTKRENEDLAMFNRVFAHDAPPPVKDDAEVPPPGPEPMTLNATPVPGMPGSFQVVPPVDASGN